MPSAFAPEEVILTGTNHRYYASHPTGQLSLKTMRGGRAIYITADGRRIAVDDSGYLILNDAQPYTIEIDGPTTLTSFCIFFPPGQGESVLHSLWSDDSALLDQPAADSAPPFYETLLPHDDQVTPAVRRIEAAYRNGHADPGWYEEHLVELLARMWIGQHEVRGQIARLPAVRASTRDELYRRLSLARDYINASLADPLTLESMAAVAALSPYHFLRSFQQAYGETPHNYLTRQRIERACFLLCHSGESITSICFAVGFSSLGSFSSLFRKITGRSPTDYRHDKRAS